MSKTEERTSTFLEQLQQLYPEKFANITPVLIDEAYNTILSSNMFWTDSGDIYATNTLTSSRNGTSFHIASNVSVPATESSDYAFSFNVNQSNKTLQSKHNTPKWNIKDASSGTSSSQVYKLSNDDNDDLLLKVFGYVFHKISLTICIILVVWVSIINLRS